MDILLNTLENKKIKEKIIISGSKSESNRLLILQKLFPEISIEKSCALRLEIYSSARTANQF